MFHCVIAKTTPSHQMLIVKIERLTFQRYFSVVLKISFNQPVKWQEKSYQNYSHFNQNASR